MPGRARDAAAIQRECVAAFVQPPEGFDPLPEEARERARHVILVRIAGFWRACPRRACRRARTCTGDAVVCYERGWIDRPRDIRTAFEWLTAPSGADDGGA